MNQYATTNELKRRARASLFGNYGVLIGSILTIQVISFIASFALEISLTPSTLGGNIIYQVSTIILQLLISIFSLGYAMQHLNVATNQPVNYATLFHGFKHPNKVILLSLMVFGITLLALLPISLLIIFLVPPLFSSTSAISNMLLIIYCISGSVIMLTIACYIALRYALIYHLLADLPTYSSWQIMKLSSQLMDGNKMRYFRLMLSFFGLGIVGMLSCGIALLWITPYMQVTSAHFYLDLMRVRSAALQAASPTTIVQS